VGDSSCQLPACHLRPLDVSSFHDIVQAIEDTTSQTERMKIVQLNCRRLRVEGMNYGRILNTQHPLSSNGFVICTRIGDDIPLSFHLVH
jgi:hypothetical protein